MTLTLFALIFAFGLLVGVGIGAVTGRRLYINQSAGEAMVANAIEAGPPQPPDQGLWLMDGWWAAGRSRGVTGLHRATPPRG